MSINLVLNQVPLVGEVAGALQSRPEVQQTTMAAHAADMGKEAKDQVQKTDEQEGAKAIREETREGASQGRGDQGERRKKKHPEDPESPTEPHTASVWAGNIVDVTI